MDVIVKGDLLTKEAIHIADSYTPRGIMASITSTEIAFHEGRLFIGIFNDNAIFDGDIVQLSSDTRQSNDGDYWQIRWDHDKHWYFLFIIQSRDKPHWIGLDFGGGVGISIETRKPYSFKTISKKINE